MPTARCYIGTFIIFADPEEKDGIAGFRIIFPDHHLEWMPFEAFNTFYREITDQELDLIFSGGQLD